MFTYTKERCIIRKEVFILKNKKREFVKYRLAIQEKDLNDLADYLEIHRNSIYLKLEDKTVITREEIRKINKYLKLTKAEAEDLWE